MADEDQKKAPQEGEATEQEKADSSETASETKPTERVESEAGGDKAKEPVTSFNQVDSGSESGEKPREDVTEVKVDLENTTEESQEQQKQEESSDSWLKDGASLPEKSNKKLFLILGVLALILGVLAGGVYYFRSSIGKRLSQEPESQVTQTPEATPSETPEASLMEITASDYKVSILNGSGIAGEANKVKEIIATEGFVDIETANASSYDFEETEISLKKDSPEALYELVDKLLSETYSTIRSEESVPEDSDFDVIVTVGSKKAESEDK